MNSPIFTLPPDALKKAGIKLLLVLLGGVATYLESFIPGFLESVVANPVFLTILLAVNTGVIDLIRKYLADREGELGGVKIN